MGIHCDPISSDKDWLIFAVRELSRVAVGKAGSQKEMWGSKYKPAWWDSECALKWKNPTTNPKDGKDTLNTKFECLVRHLRKEEQLPKDMEEEVRLWEADQKSTVFLMRNVSNALGLASKQHILVEDALHRMEKQENTVDVSTLNDLESCLSACVHKVESMKIIVNERNQTVDVTRSVTCGGNKCVSLKPTSDVPQPSCKRLKRSIVYPTSLTSSSAMSPCFAMSSSSYLPSRNTFPLVPDPSTKDDTPKVLLLVQQQPLLPKQCTKTSDTYRQSFKAQNSEPRAETSKKSKERKKRRAKKKKSENDIVADADTIGGNADGSSLPLPINPPASVPDQVASSVTENTEFRDFLELDLQGNDDDFQLLNDPHFLEDLWQDITPETSVEVISTTASITTATTSPGPVPTQSLCSTGTSHVQGGIFKLSLPCHAPLISQPFSSEIPDTLLSGSFPFCSDDSSGSVADRQAGNEWADGAMEVSGVGGVRWGEQEAEELHAKESPVASSHQSCQDFGDSSSSALDHSDLEAFLNSW